MDEILIRVRAAEVRQERRAIVDAAAEETLHMKEKEKRVISKSANKRELVAYAIRCKSLNEYLIFCNIFILT